MRSLLKRQQTERRIQSTKVEKKEITPTTKRKQPQIKALVVDSMKKIKKLQQKPEEAKMCWR